MPIRNLRAAALPAKLSRSWLLLNALQTDLFGKALGSESDSVIFDMEAPIPEDQKGEARQNVEEALHGGMSGWVRVNPINSDFWADDLKALQDAPGLRGVMLAETEKPEQVALTAMRLAAGTPVLALIESAQGIENATSIASAPGTFRLAFGVNDFRKDTGAGEDPLALAYARGKLVVASRVGRLPGPIDGPPAPVADDAQVREECTTTSRMGMTGKLVLNLEQVDRINEGLSPSEDELQWAHELLDSHSEGGTMTDGSYLPRLKRAQKIAQLADSYGLWNA